jgi:prepilin-type processing-associated H-X9-DG protein
MRSGILVLALLAAMLATAAVGQEEAPGPTPEGPVLDHLERMGVPEELRPSVIAMLRGNVNPMLMVLILEELDRGHDLSTVGPALMLSGNMFSMAPPTPSATASPGKLIITEGGRSYVVDTEAMEVIASGPLAGYEERRLAGLSEMMTALSAVGTHRALDEEAAMPADLAALIEEDPDAALQPFLDWLGLDPQAKAAATALADNRVEPMTALMLMEGMGGMGGGMDDFFFLSAFGGMRGGGPASPLMLDDGTHAYLVDSGKVEKIDLATGQSAGWVRYREDPLIKAAELMELLAPTLAAARDQAVQTACLSNVRQICTGILSYAQDHDEQYPPAEWVDAVMPYMMNEDILRCPAAPDLLPGYTLNANLAGLNLAELNVPANTVLIFDGDGTEAGGPENMRFRHDGGAMIGFADGHAKYFTAEELAEAEADLVWELEFELGP